jgi:hypothetical protein
MYENNKKNMLKSEKELMEALKGCSDNAADPNKNASCFNKLKDQFIKLFEYTKNVKTLYQFALEHLKHNQKGAGRGREGVPVKYKTTGEVVYILYNKKRIKRNIYVKVKGRPAKYCKINKEYVLLSKLSRVTPR